MRARAPSLVRCDTITFDTFQVVARIGVVVVISVHLAKTWNMSKIIKY